MISGFHHEVYEICAFLGYKAAYSGNIPEKCGSVTLFLSHKKSDFYCMTGNKQYWFLVHTTIWEQQTLNVPTAHSNMKSGKSTQTLSILGTQQDIVWNHFFFFHEGM